MCSVAFPPFLLFSEPLPLAAPCIHVNHPTCPHPLSLANTTAARDRALSRSVPPSCSLPSPIAPGLIPGKFLVMAPLPLIWGTVAGPLVLTSLQWLKTE